MRYAFVLIALLPIACGSGDDPTGPVDHAATVTISAGDGQSAAPGQAVSSALIALVRDANGAAVAGVTVQFVVTAGGGHIAKSSATSDVAGKANAGLWTLGPAGTQAIEARVGSLTPAVFHASLSVVAVEQTIGPGGGTVEISDATSPLVGTRLTIPSATFPSASTWRMSVASGAGPSLPAGFTAIGPTLRIETNQLRGGRLMTLRVPVDHRSGSVTVLLAYDASGTKFEAMPILASDNVSVTVGVTHLAGSLLLGRSGANTGLLRASATQVDGLINLQATTLPLEILGITKTILNQILNGWPAPDLGTYQHPNGHGPALPLMSLFSSIQGQLLGPSIRVLSPDGTLADTAAQASIAKIGTRFQQSLPAFQPILGDLANAFAPLTQAARDELTTLNLRVGLLASNLPQLTMFGETLSGTGNVGKMSFSTMLGITPAGFTYTTPLAPTAPQEMSLTPSGFLSRITKRVGDGPSFTAQMITALGGSFTFPVEQYADILPLLTNALSAVGIQRNTLNNSLAAQASLPAVSVQLKSTTTAPWLTVLDTVFIRDATAELRTTCGFCPGALPLYAEPTQQSIGVGTVSGTAPVRALTASATPASSSGLLGFLTAQDVKAGALLNALGIGSLRATIFATMDGSIAGILGNLQRALVPINMPVVDVPFKVEVTSQDLSPNVDIVFAAAVAHPPATGWMVDWDWGDGSPIEHINNQSTAKHKFATGGERDVRATLRNSTSYVAGNTPLAVATTPVSIVQAPLAWKFTTTNLTITSTPPQGDGYDTRWKVDSTIIARIANGTTQGGFRIVDQAFTPTGFPPRTAPVGLYLLEGTSVTLATVAHGLTENIFATKTFPEASTTVPTAPQISGWNLIQAAAPVNPLCASYEDNYTFDGSITSGHLTGLRIPLCVQSVIIPSINGLQLMSMDADVTFGTSVATGTINVIYYFYGNGNPVNFFQRKLRLAFTATRLTQ